MKKIKNLEFLKIIACIAIILLHFIYPKEIYSDIRVFQKFAQMICNASVAVELFFILSGFFFMLNFKKEVTFSYFFKKKIIRFYPVFIFALILSILIPFVNFNFYDAIITFFGFNGTPMVLERYTMHTFWYVSSLFWISLFLFYIFKNYKIENTIFFAAIASFLGYGLMINKTGGGIPNTIAYYYFINGGMLRALSGMCLGCVIAHIYKNNIEVIKNINLNISSVIIVTILEFCSLYFIINNLIFHYLKFHNKIIYIIVYAFIILLMLFKKGIISRLLDKNIMPAISRYVYSIYVTHVIIADTFHQFAINKNLIVQKYPIPFLILYIIVVFLFGIFTYHLIEKPAKNYLEKKFL